MTSVGLIKTECGLELQKQARILKRLDQLFRSRAEQEAERRKIWIAEEKERRRRIRVGNSEHSKNMEEVKEKVQQELLQKCRIVPDTLEDSVEYITRQIQASEVRLLEESERQRRMQETTIDPKRDEAHEQIQQQFMSAVHLKETKFAEEEERVRRVEADQKLERKEQWQAAYDSKTNLAITKASEEIERQRRIFQETLTDVEQEMKREIIRRQTWIAEEQERRRRILIDVGIDLQEALLSEIDRLEVAYLEEQERERRVAEDNKLAQQNELPPNSAAHEAIQEEFMAKAHQKELAEAEELEKQAQLAKDFFSEYNNSEINRRVTWMLEEQERRRRMLEDIDRDYNEFILREIQKHEVIGEEEKERERRIWVERTHSEDSVHFSEQKEEIQRELLSRIDVVKTRHAEEIERARRIQEDKKLQDRQEKDIKFESQVSQIVSRGLEEQERDRRILEELQQNLMEAADSEVDRRKVFLLEEQERQRRILESKGKIPLLSQEKQNILNAVVHHINTSVASKVQVEKGKKIISEATVDEWLKEKKSVEPNC